ncbi:carboxymethylenebutenolidase [Erythromicrobium ramosum]|uniref:Carboxymethylenebutenolidase n=1 Tax=Erythrobacter ramosus TaxID=35811 RepID=A0A6I4UII1_9SPHN|nr:dienelactone hydrolase family protein [Erythrobacter ramosus]MBB3775056.1 carboxymethylenebutenolidase [Erythrobacter ramosus]MXP37315.1 dienelactone hydrolase family protein [Erythrobacter ramosus]
MCEESKLAEWAKATISRRQFGALTGAAALAACASGEAESVAQNPLPGLKERGVSFATADGTLDGFFVQPESGNHPAVILWPDIASIREAKRNIARKLAQAGYAVLVVNPYYRDVTGEQFADFATFIADGGFQKVGPWRKKLDAAAIMRDATAIVDWLDRQDGVDQAHGIGTQGYCMGGPFTIWSAAAVPTRIKAAASFHGGGLVRPDNPMSPHKLLDKVDASLLIAVAQDDDAEAPADKTTFAEAAEAAKVGAVVTVYPGDHGWMVADSPAYDATAAARGEADLKALYAAALA